MMKVHISKAIDCTDKTSEACSDDILASLGHGADFALKADIPTDTVHGSVTILHCDIPDRHEITVEIYEGDDPPTARSSHGMIEGRQSRLLRPDPMPSEQTIRDRLN